MRSQVLPGRRPEVAMKNSSKSVIDLVDVSWYKVPTESVESDGTLEWNTTTLVLVQINSAGQSGLGYTFADEATALLIRRTLSEVVTGADPMSINYLYMQMWRRIRNLGRPGICSMAISAVDCALWDLKARLLNVPLVRLLGQIHAGAPIYGSGGFTSYSDQQLAMQLAGWVEQGIPRVKMKIGRDAHRDAERVRIAREAVGPEAELYVDANGGYGRKQALKMADHFAKFDVSWFEEPVSSDDLDGLRLIRDRAPSNMEIAAGEYGYDIFYFRRMLEAGAVDVLQADVTRCGGITGLLQVAALCQSRNLSLSCHTAPALHTHVACAVAPLKNVEYFHDHVLIENMFFDGVARPIKGELRPDLSRPGSGLELKRTEAQKFAA
jgi:L-alanine-DL-glutamate epimerase-like enolase superfamily enzyme